MKVRNILFDSQFERKFQKYKEKLTSKQKDNIKVKLMIFKENIFDERLKTHKLSWNLKDYYSIRINFRERLKFKLLPDWDVFFYDVWSHDDIY